MEKRILENKQELLRCGVIVRKIEENEGIEENEKSDEIEEIEESCGTLCHYIAHQTFQIPLEVLSCSTGGPSKSGLRHPKTYEYEEMDSHPFALGP